jgi:hypothetical protein
MNRVLVYELATARSIAQREDVLFLAPYCPETRSIALLYAAR